MKMQKKIFISGCLWAPEGKEKNTFIRFDGLSKLIIDDPIIQKWTAEDRLIRVCPEMIAGFPVPRPPTELCDGRVFTQTGEDLTEKYLYGANVVLESAIRLDVAMVILKENSPSCGVRKICDGTFSGTKIDGMGITTRVLTEAGITVFSEKEIPEANEFLQRIEAA